MTDSRTKRHTLLAVDDEATILNILERELGERFEVLTANTVEEAFQLLEEHDVDLVMSDQRMPDMTGVEFLTFVKECYPKCVRILFTAYTDTTSAIEAINSGKVYCYIEKPWEPEQLHLMLSQAVERHELIIERSALMDQLKNTNAQLERRNGELFQANQKLHELDRLKSVFMEVVSHELNTPISIIQGYGFLLRRELADSPNSTLKRAAEGIRNSTIRLENITQKIFKVLQSQTPRTALVPLPVPIRELLDEVHDTVRPFLARRGQRLKITAPDGLVVNLDGQLVSDALVSLVMNAIKFSPDDKTIALEAILTPQNQLRIRVRDTGVGIHPHDLPKIFQTFFGTFDSQHHSSGDFEFQKRGIGLGLAIAEKFVRMHGGQLTVVTEHEHGTCFSLYLPMTLQADSAAAMLHLLPSRRSF